MEDYKFQNLAWHSMKTSHLAGRQVENIALLYVITCCMTSVNNFKLK